MNAAVVLDVWIDYTCPNGCGVAERIRPQPLGSVRMHTCAKLHSLTAPLVPVGTDCKVYAVERADYLDGEEQRTGDDGRPYMAVVTERADGSNDVIVNAAVAIARLGGGQ